jgi:hypothetical protein
MDDKELIKLAYTLGFQAGMEKQAQFMKGLRNVGQAVTGLGGNGLFGRMIQGVKGLGQVAVGTGRGIQRGYNNTVNAINTGIDNTVNAWNAGVQATRNGINRGIQAVNNGYNRAIDAVNAGVNAGVNKVKQTGQAIADRTAQEWARY